MALKPTDLPALKTLLAGAAYSALSDNAAQQKLNAKTVDADVDVPIDTIRRALLSQEILGAIRARVDFYRAKLASDAAPGGANEVKLGKLHTALAAVEMLPSFGVSTKATKDFVASLLTNLVTEGVMTSAQASALLALAPGKISPAEQAFGRGATVDDADVTNARKV